MKAFSKYLSVLLVFLAPLALKAEDELVAYRDSVDNGYNFLLYVPERYYSGDTLPLIVCLHGKSLTGNDLPRVTKYGCIDAIRRGRQIDALVLCPQCNTTAGWEAKRVMNVVDWVQSRFRTDPDRLYVMGMSMGGWGTFKVVSAYPDRVTAAIAMCGGYTGPIEPLTRVPLWIIHGTADDMTPFSYSNSLVKNMIKSGKGDRVHFSWLMGSDHSILARVFLLEQPYKWLFRHSLTDERRHVCREYDIVPSDLSTAYNNLDRDKAQKLPIIQKLRDQ